VTGAATGEPPANDAPSARIQREADRFLAAVDGDGRTLLSAAGTDWGATVPHCPGWDAAGLVRHQGSIMEWMAAIVASGDRVVRRTLEPPPEEPTDLPEWYLGAMARAVSTLGAADPAAETWTFSSAGDRRVWWWCRRLAVEVAVHRWDAEQARTVRRGPVPGPLAGDVAAAGIEEYLREFLPGLLASDGVTGLVGTLQLQASDGALAWWVDLAVPGSASPAVRPADTAVRGSSSDLLLWLNNRDPSDGVEIVGDDEITRHWDQLRF
jgi:uncharacterized protein (TIGR03083 family)